GMARVLDGRDGADHIREGVRLFSLVAADPQTALDSTWVVLGLLWLRESGATRASLQAVEAARAETAVGALPRLLFHLARDGATTDRWVSAASEYLESIALAEEFGHETDEATSLAGLAWLEARQGLEEDCRRHAQRALTVAVPRHINIACIWARFALGELDLASGRMKEAVEGLIDLHAWLDAVGIRDVDVSPAPELVEALMRTGREARAREVSQIHASRAHAKGQPWSLARAARIEGILAPDTELDDVFGRALDLHALTPDLFESARTRLVFGTRLRRARRRVHARAQLPQALATFERLGARPWAQTAADELESTGETAARLGVSGVDLLTPRERQIVMLLVAGRTTRAAAAALFLSPKTVECHLRHAYTKLAISSRSELSLLVAASPEQQ
uniref:helix-turn-helix transcriptional regulator n=1 Tax=Lapillicoccus sp. TaxID=1909287 RepID=UPI0039835BD1